MSLLLISQKSFKNVYKPHKDGLNNRRQSQRKQTMNFGTMSCRGRLVEIVHALEKHHFQIITSTEIKKQGRGHHNRYQNASVAQSVVSIPIEELRKRITVSEAVDKNRIKINLNILQYKVLIFGVYEISSDTYINEQDQLFGRSKSRNIKCRNNRGTKI